MSSPNRPSTSDFVKSLTEELGLSPRTAVTQVVAVMIACVFSDIPEDGTLPREEEVPSYALRINTEGDKSLGLFLYAIVSDKATDALMKAFERDDYLKDFEITILSMQTDGTMQYVIPSGGSNPANNKAGVVIRRIK